MSKDELIKNELSWEEIEELQKYGDLDGCELGDLCRSLCQVAQFPSYTSDEFNDALHKEMRRQLDEFKMYSKIVETKETITHTVVSLEWL